MGAAPDSMRTEGAPVACTRSITVTVSGTACSVMVRPGETAAHVLARLKESLSVEVEGVELHTTDGMMLTMDDDLWSVVAEGETLFAIPASVNAERTSPAAARCPRCWNQ